MEKILPLVSAWAPPLSQLSMTMNNPKAAIPEKNRNMAQAGAEIRHP